MAADNGQLQLNAFEPSIAHALLQSLGWLAQGCEVLRSLCIEGIEANEGHLRKQADISTAQATALLPLIGYAAAADIAHRASASGQKVVDLAVKEGLLSASDAEPFRATR
jgi:aspartate ammonia-lyase